MFFNRAGSVPLKATTMACVFGIVSRRLYQVRNCIDETQYDQVKRVNHSRATDETESLCAVVFDECGLLEIGITIASVTRPTLNQ